MIKCKDCKFETESRSSFKKHCKKEGHEDTLISEWRCGFCGIHIEEKLKRGRHTSQCKSNPNYEKTREKISKASLGRRHSDKTKKLLSVKRKRYLASIDNQYLPHSSKKSYPESLIETEFSRRGINGWSHNFQNGTYKYDFAFPELKVDIEIDGRQHSVESRKEHDRLRDEWSKSQGWKVLRICASIVRKDSSKAVDLILEFLEKSRR